MEIKKILLFLYSSTSKVKTETRVVNSNIYVLWNDDLTNSHGRDVFTYIYLKN